MASGSPSSRRHTSATAAAFSSSARSAAGAARPARRTAARPRSAAAPSARPVAAAGTDSGGTGQHCSPARPSGSRLVARILSPGQAREQGVGQRGAGLDQVLAVVQHQQQASGAQVSRQGLRQRAPGLPRARPGARATAWGTSAGSAIGASSTNQTPSAKRVQPGRLPAAARRVFPTRRRRSRSAAACPPAGAAPPPFPAHAPRSWSGGREGCCVRPRPGTGSRPGGPSR